MVGKGVVGREGSGSPKKEGERQKKKGHSKKFHRPIQKPGGETGGREVVGITVKKQRNRAALKHLKTPVVKKQKWGKGTRGDASHRKSIPGDSKWFRCKAAQGPGGGLSGSGA